MPAQLVSYDLRKPGRDYANLFSAIKSIGTTWWHCLESVWIVKTTLTSTQVRDQLQPHIDANDELVVTGLDGGWGSSGLDKDCNDWLRKNL